MISNSIIAELPYSLPTIILVAGMDNYESVPPWEIRRPPGANIMIASAGAVLLQNPLTAEGPTCLTRLIILIELHLLI